MSEQTHREQLEAIVVDYIERFGMTEKAQQYFQRLYLEVPNVTRTELERRKNQASPS